MAEAYWDLEWQLQQQGFDFCYDKKLYDRLEHGPARERAAASLADLAYQERLVRFIENHDEPRAAADLFPGKRQRAAAVIATTLPGATLLHEGQFEGRKVRLPVFLARRPGEPIDQELREFYQRLLPVITAAPMRTGGWRLLECRPAWDGNHSCESFITYAWEHVDGERRLIAVNYAPHWSQGYVQLAFPDLAGRQWLLEDRLGEARYLRDGNDLLARGLYLDLGPWQHHVFAVQGR